MLDGSWKPLTRWQVVVALVATMVGLVIVGAAAGLAVGVILNFYGPR